MGGPRPFRFGTAKHDPLVPSGCAVYNGAVRDASGRTGAIVRRAPAAGRACSSAGGIRLRERHATGGDGGDEATVGRRRYAGRRADDAPEGADGDDVGSTARARGDGAASDDAEPDADGAETDADGEAPGDADADADAGPLADADGDTISDIDEGDADTDWDGLPDKNDLDSDDDGVPDADEAGDSDLATPPDDCDGDGMPNFRDRDSDDDCLRDGDEMFMYGTDPCSADTDGDGISDMIELAYGSNPLDGTDHWRDRGDYVFLVPYGLPPTPVDDVFVFSTSLQLADVYFLIDTSATMTGEIAGFRSALLATMIPGIIASVPDVWFGIGRFSDYAATPYGEPGDEVFVPEQRLTTDRTAVTAAAARLTAEGGGDEPDAAVVALQAFASGDGGALCPRPAPAACSAGFGYPCFRPDAVPLVVLITDATLHSGPGGTEPYGTVETGTCTAVPPTYDAARDALVASRIRVLGIESGGSAAARGQLEQLVRDTGAVDGGGTALVFDVSADGTGLGAAVVDVVRRYASEVPMSVHLLLVDDPWTAWTPWRSSSTTPRLTSRDTHCGIP